jgi:hypothetical protein
VEDQKSCLTCIGRHLRDGGRLVFNVFNPDLVAMGRWMSDLQGDWHLWRDSTDQSTGGRILSWESRRYRTGSQEANVLWKVEELDADGRPRSRGTGPAPALVLPLRGEHRWTSPQVSTTAGSTAVFRDNSPDGLGT